MTNNDDTRLRFGGAVKPILNCADDAFRIRGQSFRHSGHSSYHYQAAEWIHGVSFEVDAELGSYTETA